MTFISTTGHGYLQITHNQLKKAILMGFKPTTCSFINKRNVLLEEDCDAPAFMKVFFADEYQEKWQSMQSKHQDNINRNACFVIPTSLEEFVNFKDRIIDYANLKKDMVLISQNNDKFYATGSYQKRSAIVKDIFGTVWTLPFNNVKEIKKVEVA